MLYSLGVQQSYGQSFQLEPFINAAVLNSSPRAPPRSAYFVCYSYRFRCLFYWNVSALRSGHHRIFHHDSSSKRTYIFHSKCARRELKLYIFTEVYDVTLVRA